MLTKPAARKGLSLALPSVSNVLEARIVCRGTRTPRGLRSVRRSALTFSDHDKALNSRRTGGVSRKRAAKVLRLGQALFVLFPAKFSTCRAFHRSIQNSVGLFWRLAMIWKCLSVRIFISARSSGPEILGSSSEPPAACRSPINGLPKQK